MGDEGIGGDLEPRGDGATPIRTVRADQIDGRGRPEVDHDDRPAFLAAAVRVGSVRLIDNIAFDIVGGEVMADRGVRLSRQSILYR